MYMNPWMFLFLWVGSQALQLIFGVLAVCQQPDAGGHKRLGSLIVSGVASAPPFVTLVLFLRVFVFGGSSNVAQLAGESGLDLWRLWFHAWPLLFFGNPLAFLVALAVAILPPYPPGRWQSFASRVCAVVAAGFAWYMVVTFFPDA
jgi:hypothetical protein